jgi:hypothetical protein
VVLRAPLLAALVLGALASGAGGRDWDGLTVETGEARFRGDGGAALRLRGTFRQDAEAFPADPRGEGLRVTVGSLALLDGDPLPGTARVRARARGGWVLTLRRAFEGRGRLVLSMDPERASFRLRAAGARGAALRDAGGAGVEARVELGARSWSSTLDFVERSPRRWTYRLEVPVVPRPGTGGGGGAPPPGGGGGGGGGGDGGGAPVPLATLAQGSASAIQGFRFAVAKDASAWAALWAQHGGSGSPPAVDFTTEMVIGYWTGARPTGGYWAQVTGITGANAPPGQTGVLVTLEEVRPGPNCVVTQAETRPFHLVRTSMRADVVNFEQVVRTANCP